MLNFIKNFILDTLFPIHCLNCGKYSEWICKECLEKISVIQIQVCPYCEKNISPAGRICQTCKIKFLEKNKLILLDALLVSAKYEKNGISRLVHNFKYNFIQDLGFFLGQVISRAIMLNNLPLPDIIIPIPLHKRRLRWRGFNQSKVLAKNISEILTPGFSLPVISDLLIRKKYTHPQMKLKNYTERQKNVQDIFGIRKNFPDQEIVKDKVVLLIDDIATTGSTLFEAAKILKSAGAKKVYGAVVARQEIK